MNYDFYIQGLSEVDDGSLMISLREEELDKVTSHPFFKSQAGIPDLLRIIKKSIEPIGIVTFKPKDLEEHLEPIQEESDFFKRNYRTNTPENPPIQQDFYLDAFIRILKHNLEKTQKESRDIIVIKNELQLPSANFAKTYKTGLGFCGINSAEIRFADVKERKYKGVVQWFDSIERYETQDKWVAFPVPEIIRIKRESPLYVRPEDINGLTNQYHLTLIEGFNEFFEQYVNQTISEYRKEF